MEKRINLKNYKCSFFYSALFLCIIFILISCSRANEVKNNNSCDSLKRIFSLIEKITKNKKIYMSGIGDSVRYKFMKFPEEFSVKGNFTTPTNDPIQITTEKNTDSVKGGLILFKEIFFNTEYDSAFVEVNYYSMKKLRTSTKFTLSLDTLNCNWLIKNEESFVY